ncbi:unnamed protein product [Cuscuta epithymum]|uniref:Transposase (putative) gypsy type domain-containing protein n=2 Tax=Cuscuta epithymum TaxID=186058 RepID=A0AAV0GFB2_9ASTE|nr:unnamed protein product [Cuscuta epithymum]
MDILDSIDSDELLSGYGELVLENFPHPWADVNSDVEEISPIKPRAASVKPPKRRYRGPYPPLDPSPILHYRSRLSVSKFEKYKKFFPSTVTVRCPDSEDIVTDPPKGHFFGVHILSIKLGFRFPTHPLIIEFLNDLEISPCHLTPLGHQYLVAFLVRCETLGIESSLDLFKHMFRAGQCSASDSLSWVSISQRNHFDMWKVTRSNEANWKEEFVYVSSGSPLPFSSSLNCRFKKYSYPKLPVDQETWPAMILSGGPYSLSAFTSEDRLTTVGLYSPSPCSGAHASTSTDQDMTSRLEMFQSFDQDGPRGSDQGRSDKKPRVPSVTKGKDAIVTVPSSIAKRRAASPAARVTRSMSDIPTAGMTTWLRGNIELPPLLSQVITATEKEKISTLDHAALEKRSHHGLAELLLSISEVNRRKDEREKDLSLQLTELAKEVASLKLVRDSHAAEVTVLKEMHAVELANARGRAVDAYKNSPEFVSDQEAYINAHLNDISKHWLSTPEGREKLALESYISYQIGIYATQQKVYPILRDKAGASCITDWGLPPEVPNPEIPVANTPLDYIPFDRLPTDEELGDLPSETDHPASTASVP